MKQLIWYAVQTAIVVGIVYFDSTRPDPTPGAALFLGVGWAIALTVVFHLIADGLKRLAWRLGIISTHPVRERRDESRRVVPHG